MIQENLDAVRKIIGDTRLIAVSKNRSDEELKELYDCGVRIMAENRVQELTRKHESLPGDIEWHMIGHLQRNKVKYIVPFVRMIHSIDSLRLLREVNKQAARVGRVIDVLLQVHIAEEDSKFGFSPDDIRELVGSGVLKEFENVSIRGLMGMATFTDDESQVESEFRSLALLKDEISKQMPQPDQFNELSIGMSQDCHIAVKCGSTMLRIGSRLFE